MTTRTFAIFDADGRWVKTFTGPDDEIDMNTRESEVAVPGHIDPKTQYFDGATVVSRPLVDVPASHAIAVGAVWELPGVPGDTVVSIDGAAAGTVGDDALELVFPDAGDWRVTFDPPFPWRGAETLVTAS